MIRQKPRAVCIVAAILIVVPINAQNVDPLVAAYEKEFLYLDNEIQLLRERIVEVDVEGAARLQSSLADLDALGTRLLNLGSAVDRRSDELRIVEEERNEAVGATNALDSILSQSTLRLGDFGIPKFSDFDPQGAELQTGDALKRLELTYMFDASLSLLEKLGTVHSEEGEFFLENGAQVQGEIINIGRIASYGVSGSSGGTLVPAGGGMLRVGESGSFQVARQLQQGEAPPALPIYLYESLDYVVDRSKTKTLRAIVDSGGIIGYVIVILGLLAATLIVLRGISLYRTSTKDGPLLEEVVSHVQRKDFDAALSATENPKGALSRIIASTVRCLAHEPARVDDVMAESFLNEQPSLERFRSAITVLAAVAPLLGLLGTVTGMISTFDVITEYGTGDPKLLSGGISEALVTTELGLIVAIPTLLIGNLLTSWADRIVARLEVSALQVVNTALGFDSSSGIDG